MKIKEGFELQNVCGEHIVVPTGEENMDFSQIISLNPTAAYLWENIAGKEFGVEDLVQLLLKEDIALEDSKLIVECWKEMGLVE